jgi:hypothetical protein
MPATCRQKEDDADKSNFRDSSIGLENNVTLILFVAASYISDKLRTVHQPNILLFCALSRLFPVQSTTHPYLNFGPIPWGQGNFD